MLIKDYQVEISNKKFQRYKLFVLEDDRKLLSTISYKSSYDSEYGSQSLVVDSYNSYLSKEGKCELLEGLNILDVYNVHSKRYGQSLKETVSENLLCSSEGFKNKYKNSLKMKNIYFEQNVNNTSYFLDENNLVTSSMQDKCFYKKEMHPKNQFQTEVLFDFSSQQQLQKICSHVQVLNRKQLLLSSNDHLDTERFQPFLLKLDLEDKKYSWKFQSHRIFLISSPVLINQCSFMTGFYDVQDNISSLKLFDFRVQGPVVKLLQSNSDDIIRQSVNRNLNTNFQLICPSNSPYQFISVLSYRGGKKSLPYWFDYRKPDHLELIRMKKEDDLSHLMGLHFHRDKLITIERVFHEYQFRKAKLSEYRIQM